MKIYKGSPKLSVLINTEKKIVNWTLLQTLDDRINWNEIETDEDDYDSVVELIEENNIELQDNN